LKLSDLPENLREEYQPRVRDNRLVLGLREDYELLFKLGDLIGAKFIEKKEKILNALTRRNLSIGAHGVNPLSEEDYRLVKDILGGFIVEAATECDITLQIPQLPNVGIL
jgi:hypothetical protein